MSAVFELLSRLQLPHWLIVAGSILIITSALGLLIARRKS